MTDIAFLCMDLETAGLDGVILELSIVAADADLNPVAQFTSLVHPGNLELAKAQMNEFVTEMHTGNGLLTDLEQIDRHPQYYIHTTYSAMAVERQVLLWLENLGLESGTYPMFGSTIGFDRGRLKLFMKELEAWFHYRNIDISTIKELIKIWRPDEEKWRPKGSKVHRSLADCMSTLDEARLYKDAYFS